VYQIRPIAADLYISLTIWLPIVITICPDIFVLVYPYNFITLQLSTGITLYLYNYVSI